MMNKQYLLNGLDWLKNIENHFLQNALGFDKAGKMRFVWIPAIEKLINGLPLTEEDSKNLKDSFELTKDTFGGEVGERP